MSELFLEKKREYTDAQVACMAEAFECLDGLGDDPLMLLGKIQSGKTKAFIGVMALAMDHGYDLAIILTKSSNALAKQTLTRLHDEFKPAIEEAEILDIYDVMKMPKTLSEYELHKKIIVVVKKQKDNLRHLLAFIEQYGQENFKKCLVIDDEADYGSIGYEKNKTTEEFSLRKIASQINALRTSLDCRFIQVTATPYALYLQPEEVLIQEAKMKPVKPAKTVLVPSGEGYIGGEYYFQSQRSTHLFKMIDEKELTVLKTSDRRRFKLEETLHASSIAGFRHAILTFIVGGCIRMLQNDGFNEKMAPKGKKNKFSFIVHTEIAKSAHGNQYDIVQQLLKDLKTIDEHQIIEWIRPIYEELKVSISVYEFQVPPFAEVVHYFKRAVLGWIKVEVVNSNAEAEQLLDEQTGQLKLRNPLTIFVGGQILDRGITISQLIGFYYGRKPQKMQQDTVLQHARMFGYREMVDLAVTRLYTTLDLYERMKKINEMDHQLREDFERGKLNEGIIFMGSDESGKIVPCAPNKVMLSNPRVIKAHKRIVPYGFNTKAKSKIKSTVMKMDRLMESHNQNQKQESFKIPKRVALELVKYFYETIDESDVMSVSQKEFLSLLSYLSHKEVNVVVKINRDMPRLRGNMEYIDSPEGAGVVPKARKLATKEPTLIMLRQRGKKEKGWKDAEFWWPVLVTPKTTITSMFTPDGDN